MEQKSNSAGVLVFIFSFIAALSLGAIVWLKSVQNERIANDNKLTDYGALPDFKFEDRSGKKMSFNDLKGQIWIADFIFTTCHGPCILMTQKMAELQTSLAKTKGNVKLVSITVDPETDTKEVLDKYAKNYGAKDSWYFIRSSYEETQDLAKKGFKMTLMRDSTENAEDDFIHSVKFVLVDKMGHIRGYYNSEEPEFHAKLITDIGVLLREKES